MDIFAPETDVLALELKFTHNNPGNPRLNATVLGARVAEFSNKFPLQTQGDSGDEEVLLTLALKGVFLIGANEEPIAEGQTPYTRVGLAAKEVRVYFPEGATEESANDTTLKDLNDRVKTLTEENSNYAKQIDDRRDTDTTEVETLRAENERLRRENEDLEAQMDALTSPPETTGDTTSSDKPSEDNSGTTTATTEDTSMGNGNQSSNNEDIKNNPENTGETAENKGTPESNVGNGGSDEATVQEVDESQNHPEPKEGNTGGMNDGSKNF